MKQYVNFAHKDHSQSFETVLAEIARAGARKMLQQALENEVEEYIARSRDTRTENHQRALVRNGHLPERAIQTGIGPLLIKQPRVRDKSGLKKFVSSILPPYLRRSPSIETLILSSRELQLFAWVLLQEQNQYHRRNQELFRPY